MSIPPPDSNKMVTITCSQTRKNSSLVKSVEDSTLVPLKAKRKTQENIDKNSQCFETPIQR